VVARVAGAGGRCAFFDAVGFRKWNIVLQVCGTLVPMVVMGIIHSTTAKLYQRAFYVFRRRFYGDMSYDL
jgi:hypothetical protein